MWQPIPSPTDIAATLATTELRTDPRHPNIKYAHLLDSALFTAGVMQLEPEGARQASTGPEHTLVRP